VAAGDPDHRPATTALYHLARAGDEASYVRLRALAESADQLWQRAAATLIIKLGDPGTGAGRHQPERARPEDQAR
jgi:hypothetical protein